VASSKELDPSAVTDADSAVTALYARHYAGLTRMAWLLVRDQGLAEDIVQDSFVELHRRWRSLRSSDAATAYLRRTVVNRCRSAGRHRAVEMRYLTIESGLADAAGRGSAGSAEDCALGHTEHARLIAEINRLPTREREVTVLRYYADLSEEQIAEALSISRGAVKGYAHRAVADLRARLIPGSKEPELP